MRRCTKCGRQLGRYAAADVRVCRLCRNRSTRKRQQAVNRAAAQSATDKRCERCDEQLRPRARSPLCQGCRDADRRKREREARRAAGLVCCYPGCDRLLGEKNETGYCVDHFRYNPDYQPHRIRWGSMSPERAAAPRPGEATDA